MQRNRREEKRRKLRKEDRVEKLREEDEEKGNRRRTLGKRQDTGK
jgi:hypothetical protein